MKKQLLSLIATLAFSFAVAPLAMAQTTSGDLVGLVKDASGAAVPGAAVVVTNEATGVKSKITSNGQGEYRASNLLPGTYDIQATATGFQATTLKGVVVQLNATATADVQVSIGGQSTTVEVSSDSTLVLDTTSQNLSQTFQAQELATLANVSIGQGVINTSLLVPGVGSTGGIGIGVGPSIAGQRQRDNNFTIEGIDNNNKAVTGPLVAVPNDAVGEFTLITAQFSPEFGHSSAGQFNTNIISGTNTFHGKLYEYFQNRNLNAAFGTAGNKLPNARYDNNRYGAQLGGPIFRDHLFFFGNYERNVIGQSIQDSICVPDTAGRAAILAKSGQAGYSTTNITQFLQYEPLANSANAAAVCGLTTVALTGGPTDASGNLTGANQGSFSVGTYNVNAPTYSNRQSLTTGMDYTISSSDSFRGRYIYNTIPTFDTAASLPAFYLSNPNKFHLVALSEFHNFTPNFVNEIRVGFNRFENATVSGAQTYPGLDAFPNLLFLDLSGSVNAQIGPDPNAPQFTIQNLYQVTDNLSYTKGKHTIKIGFDGRKYISPQGFTQRARGDYDYSNTSDFLHDFVPDALGERSSGSHTYYGDQTALYGYANDTWRVTPTLTLNYGLRYEFTSVPTGERAQVLNSVANVPGLISFGVPQPAYTSFAPRFGFAYAPDSKTSIRAGYGLAYDVLFDNLGTLSFPPQFSVTQDVQGYGSAPCTSTPPVSGCPGFLAGGGLKPGSGSGTAVLSAAAARAGTSAYIPNQVVPYTQSYTLTIQRQIGSGLTAEVGYIGTHGVHLPAQQRINIQPETTLQNYLPTFLNGTAINGQGASATSLGAIQANPTKNYVPAFYNAGFTGNVVSFAPVSGSNYNGLVTSLQGRMKNGIQLLTSYTYSKTMDNATAEVFATSLTPRRPQNPQDFRSEYSRSGLSHTHRLTVEADYNFKAFKGQNWVVRNVVSNWVFSPIYTYESPEYATVLNGSNALLTGDSAYVGRPIVNVYGVPNTYSSVTPVYSTALVTLCAPPATQCAANTIGYTVNNPNAYYIKAGAGALPNAARNTLPGRPTDNLDFAALKRFTAFERYTLEFGAQALNVLNHAQYIPGSVDDAGTYSYTGTTYQTIGSGLFNHPELAFGNNPRVIQLSAKFLF